MLSNITNILLISTIVTWIKQDFLSVYQHPCLSRVQVSPALMTARNTVNVGVVTSQFLV